MAKRCPAYDRFTVLSVVPFISSFTISRLWLERGDFVISSERSERLQRLNEGCGKACVFRDGFHGHTIGFHAT